jgi:hypothetical protein
METVVNERWFEPGAPGGCDFAPEVRAGSLKKGERRLTGPQTALQMQNVEVLYAGDGNLKFSQRQAYPIRWLKRRYGLFRNYPAIVAAEPLLTCVMAEFSNFRKSIGSPVQEFVLPIIPRTATLSRNNRLSSQELSEISGYHNKAGEWGWAKNYTAQIQLGRRVGWQVEAGPIEVATNHAHPVVRQRAMDGLEYWP